MKKALICMMQLHKKSGSARTALQNIRYFLDKGYEVHVASMTIDQELIIASGAIAHKMIPYFKSTGLQRRRWYDWQVQRLRQRLKPDITVGHGDISDQDVLTLHNSVFLASELIHGKPLDAHHEMSRTHGSLLMNQSFNKMIANSKLMKQDTVSRFGISPEIIEVIYPALDTKTFFPRPEKKAELRKRFGFKDKVVVSLVTSGNFKKRGLDFFIEAIDQLPPAIKNQTNFRVLGKDKISLHPLLTFDPALEDIECYYNAIDIFVLPARIEEFGRVVLEAMGCGLPVITTDKVGAAELLSEESQEFIIPSHDGQGLAQALTKLVEDPQLRARLGQLNARLAQQEAEERLPEKFDRVFSSFSI